MFLLGDLQCSRCQVVYKTCVSYFSMLTLYQQWVWIPKVLVPLANAKKGHNKQDKRDKNSLVVECFAIVKKICANVSRDMSGFIS